MATRSHASSFPIEIGAFRLDPPAGELVGPDGPIKLRRKTWAVLTYLVGRPGELITFADLVRDVWLGVNVSVDTIATSIRELRAAFGDQARAPTFIETVHGRGYRFIAPVVRNGRPLTARETEVGEAQCVVGRDDILLALLDEYSRTRRGHPRVALVRGPAGIGKTVLVGMFLDDIAARKDVLVGRGYCVRQGGRGEPYLPLVGMLQSLANGPQATQVCTVLRRYAPQWLELMPSILGDEQIRKPASRGFAPQMLREFVDAVYVLQRTYPLVFVIEDAQWADQATVDVLVGLMRRPDAGRLLLLATARSGETAVGEKSSGPTRLANESFTTVHQLDPLSRAEVAGLCDRRYPGHDFPIELASALHEATDGHPLFLVTALDGLMAAESIRPSHGGWELTEDLAAVTRRIPGSLDVTVRRYVDRLDTVHRRMADAAAVVGSSFTADTVAKVLDRAPSEIEIGCSRMADGGYLRELGDKRWPDGTVSREFRFTHDLFRDHLYAAIAPSLRQSLHRSIAATLTRVLQTQTRQQAALLAYHFEQGGELDAAARGYYDAATHAATVGSVEEALGHLRTGMDLLAPLNPNQERNAILLRFATARASQLLFTEGFDHSDVPELFALIERMFEPTGDPSVWLPSFVACQLYALWKQDFSRVLELDQRIRTVLTKTDDPAIRLQAHRAIGVMATMRGRFVGGLEHLERALELYDAGHRPADIMLYRSDIGVDSASFRAVCLLMSGQADAAVEAAEGALRRARAVAHPPSVAFAMHVRSAIRHGRLEWKEAAASGADHVEYSAKNGLEFSRLEGEGLRRWAEFEGGERQDGIDSLSMAAGSGDPTGATFYGPYFVGRLALALARDGKGDEAIAVVESALATWSAYGGHASDPELHRILANLLRARDPERACAELVQAHHIAEQSGAVLFRLRAAVDLLSWGAPQDGAWRVAVTTALDDLDACAELPDAMAARLCLAAADPDAA